ncbi:MAG: metal ABC transporter ATP-binding protein [Desulfobacterales bacterium]|nr:metal ABC transporter ATP-binding protein [Desulfobacterales bacterium]NNL41328.1 metal ABC transporter ATP-binding protein [Desulfobacterales bacterium]
MDKPVIDIKNVWFSFNREPVLQDVQFTLYHKEFLAMIGPNGGGKTTLLKLMMGLLQADRGEIRIFGQSPKQAAHRIGYVPQDIHINKNFPISVLDVVLMGRLKSGISWSHRKKDDRIAAERSLEKLEMDQFKDRHIDELSGGQRQRVFIARALVTQPEILILDEPTASVDTKGHTEIYSILKDLNEKVTILVVSHDILALSSYIKSVACVNRRVHFHGAAEVTTDMLEMAYQCPVELIAHGLPHRVLSEHSGD